MTVAGEGQGSAGEATGRPAPRRKNQVVRWRDWSLPVKLGAVTLVPIVLALVLGWVTLRGQVEQSERYERVHRLAQLNGSVLVVLDGLQEERRRATAALTEGRPPGPDLRRVRGEVDRAADALRTAAERAAAVSGGLAESRTAATEQLDRLPRLRQQIGAGQVGPVQAANEYTRITGALLNLDSSLVAGIGEDAVGGTASALHDLLVAKEEIAVQQVLIAYGVERGGLAPSELNQLRTAEVRLADRLAEFRTAATDAQRADYDRTLGGKPFESRDRIIETLLAGQDSGEGSVADVPLREWTDSSMAVFTGLGDVAKRIGGELTDTATNLADDASTTTGLLAVLLFAALVLAGIVVFAITRQLLRSLKLLRRSALEVADNELPTAVRAIQEGGSHDADIKPVPVHTADEVGEVARAFDAVHSQALRLAVEQASMRTGFSSVFVNLSRRSQSLVQRQLGLIETLERDEEDADQLSTLFQLDHLATRMRRNNENLMVLSGAEIGRRTGPPVTATDVLRAAVSEIEQYQRVVVRTPPAVRVVGYAAGDLVRLIAELLDNATAFSAPETQVTVASQHAPGGPLSIDIIDKGIGMNTAEVAEANSRLSETGSLDLATSRRMGLFVVGKLAGRHGFGVVLHGGQDIVGVRATVTVPASVLTEDAQAADAATGVMAPAPSATPQPIPRQQAPQQPEDKPRGLTPAGGELPRRTPSNGAVRPGVLPGAGPEPPVSDSEASGTALFTPLERDSDGEPIGRQEPAASGTPGQHGWPEAEPADAQHTDLFGGPSTEVSDWWNKAAAESERPKEPESRVPEVSAVEETTPIFDEMLSAWFRKVTDPLRPPGELPPPPELPEPPRGATAATSGAAAKDSGDGADGEDGATAEGAEGDAAGQRRSGDWEFAADDDWRAVQAVSENEPSAYTDKGLPRRQRGEHLLPGSATSEPSGGSPTRAAAREVGLPPRDPAQVRTRLSSFQQGVSRGRRHAAEPEAEPAAAAPAESEAPEAGAAEIPETGEIRETQAETEAATEAQSSVTSAGLPQRKPRKGPAAGRPPTRPSQDPREREAARTSASAPAAEWAFATDEGWRTVQTVSESSPSSYTSAGLPRRQRGEQLVPGSATPSGDDASRPTIGRDPADVKGRLSSFQQGVRRGRHQTTQATETTDEKGGSE